MNILERLIAWFKHPVQTVPDLEPEVVPPVVPVNPEVKDEALSDPSPTAVFEPVPTAPAVLTPLKPSASFDVSILYILKNEGGFVNDPVDRGGATNHGITMATYAAFKGRKVTVAEIKAMPLTEAKAIYKKSYWTPMLEQIDQGVATAIFDWSVLHGTLNARKLAQQVANAYGHKLVVDGFIGPASVEAINQVNPKVFVAKYALEIKAYFQRLVARNPSQKRFLNGWNNRANRIANLA